MKTMSIAEEAVKIAGAPLERLLRTGDNFTLHEEELEKVERPDEAGKLSFALSNSIAAPAEDEAFAYQETPRDSVIEGNSKLVRFPTLVRRETIVESPRSESLRSYLVKERREAEVWENFTFIVLWLSSLVALGYFISL